MKARGAANPRRQQGFTLIELAVVLLLLGLLVALAAKGWAWVAHAFH